MPRNKSEKGLRVLLRKMVTPATWGDSTEVRLTQKPDGTYWVSSAATLDRPNTTWVSGVADLAEGRRAFDEMVENFWFDKIPHTYFRAVTNWDGLDAA